MKMNLQSRNRNPGGKRQSIWYAALVCVLIIVFIALFQTFWLQIFYAVSAPFVFIRNSISSDFGGITSGFQSNGFLVTQNAELEQDIARLNALLLSMQALESENISLAKMVGHSPVASPKNMVVANVLFGPPTSPYDTLIVNAGEKDGIAIGNTVFADDGTPIGSIAEVYATFSKVSLYSSPGTSFSVVVGKNNVHETAIGEGEGNFSMKIPVALVPLVGDAVYLPQFEPTAIGAVTSATFAPSDSFATILFSFPVNVFTLSNVTIDTSTTITSYEAAAH